MKDLDESEMAVMESFLRDAQGRFGTFSFVDPWDSSVHTNCSLGADGAAFLLLGEMRGRTSVTVVENR